MSAIDLTHKVLRLKVIGEDIKVLLEESKSLRKDISILVEQLNLGIIDSEEPVSFVVGNLLVSIVKPKDEKDKDFVVLFKPINVYFVD